MASSFQLNDPTMPSLGAALAQQVQGETEEERRQRMALMSQQRSLGPGAQLSISSLLAPSGGKSAGY